MHIRNLSVELDVNTGGVIIISSNGKETSLHPIWLRERAQDSSNFDMQTRQRLYEPTDIDNDITILSAKIKPSDKLDVIFSDGLKSFISLTQILTELGWQEDCETKPEPIAWTSQFHDWPKAKWDDIYSHKKLKPYLEQYYKYGFLLIENTPVEYDSLITIAKTFGCIRETNFGILFDVETKIDPNDLADTSLALPAHTDNPYRRPTPGIQFLHCLHNDVKGGHATLVDGLAVVDELKRIDLEMVEVLSTTRVRFRYESDDTILQSFGSHIEYDCAGKLKCIRLSSRVDYVPHLGNEILSRFYVARKLMHKLANDPRFQIKFTYEPGLLLMMDNTRLLHGRTAYDNKQGQRLLQGCYIDHDGPDSLFRQVSKNLLSPITKREDC